MMNKVYQLVFKDYFEDYCYHIAMSLDKSKLETMIERVKNADEENKRIFYDNADNVVELLEIFYEQLVCDNTFPLNQIEDCDWTSDGGYNYSPIEFSHRLEIREYELE